MMPMPTWRLAPVAVVLAALSLVLPFGLVATAIVVNSFLALLLAVDGLAAPSPGSLMVQRSLPAVLTVGQTARVEWAVENPTGRTVNIAVADELAPSLQADDRRFSTQLPALGRAMASTAIRPMRRGAFPVTDITVRVEGREPDFFVLLLSLFFAPPGPRQRVRPSPRAIRFAK